MRVNDCSFNSESLHFSDWILEYRLNYRLSLRVTTRVPTPSWRDVPTFPPSDTPKLFPPVLKWDL